MESSHHEEEKNSSSVSASESSFITDLEGGKVTLTFTTDDLENYAACKRVLEWVGPDIPICSMEDRSHGTKMDDSEEGMDDTALMQIPSLAIVVFLTEQEEEDRTLKEVKEFFESDPWVFHHSETVTRTASNATNSLDYFRAGNAGPLCGVRQMPTGKRIVRIVRFISNDQWQDNVDLYELILGQQPEVTKPDFCLFTTGQMDDYTIQFALKRAPKGISCSPVGNCQLNFRINHPGHIVPLLPFVCDNITDRCWLSRDFDSNTINFEARMFHCKMVFTNTENDRGAIDDDESLNKYLDAVPDSSKVCIQVENPWGSPISPTDSGQYSNHYDPSVLHFQGSHPLKAYQLDIRRQSESRCSSDLGFQDRFSSSCASECRQDDLCDSQLELRGERPGPINYQGAKSNKELRNKYCYSDSAQSESDGYASSSAFNEPRLSSLQNQPSQFNDFGSLRKSPYVNRDSRRHSNPKTNFTTQHYENVTSLQDSRSLHLWHQTTKSAKTPQQYAFEKLKKYKEIQGKALSQEPLDLFNVSSHSSQEIRSSSLSRPRKRQPKAFAEDLKPSSGPDSLENSDGEFERAYQSIERDLEIINDALYGKTRKHFGNPSQDQTRPKPKNFARHKMKLQKTSEDHRNRPQEHLRITDAPSRHVDSQTPLPYVQGFYV